MPKASRQQKLLDSLLAEKEQWTEDRKKLQELLYEKSKAAETTAQELESIQEHAKHHAARVAVLDVEITRLRAERDKQEEELDILKQQAITSRHVPGRVNGV